MATTLRTVSARIVGSGRATKVASALASVALAGALASCGGPPPELTVTARFQYGCRSDTTCSSGAPLITGTQNTGTPPLTVTCLMDRTTSPGIVRFRVRASRGAAGSSIESAREGFVICGEVPESTTGGMTAVQNSKFDLYIGGTAVVAQPGSTCPVFINGLTTTSIEGQFKCEGARDNNTPARLFYVAGTTDSQNMTASPEYGEFQFTTCRAAAITSCL